LIIGAIANQVLLNYIAVSMNKLVSLLIIYFVCTFYCNDSLAQAHQNDTLRQHLMAANMDNFYNKVIGRQSRLYNGFAYQMVTINSPGNAYFKDSTRLATGNVKYGGILYRNIPLLYDIYKDLLISRTENGLFLFSFINEQVDNFDLLDHHFINLPAADPGNIVAAGFYDELYTGNQIQLLVKRAKIFQEDFHGARDGRISFNALVNDKYYLKKDSVYYRISSNGKFLNVLGDKKKELKKYLKDNNINYKANPEQAMLLMANYYNSVTK
jgi:hypothetical protein